MKENSPIPKEAITISEGRIVFVSSVIKRNFENQRRLEGERTGERRVAGMVDGKRISKTRDEIRRFK